MRMCLAFLLFCFECSYCLRGSLSSAINVWLYRAIAGSFKVESKFQRFASLFSMIHHHQHIIHSLFCRLVLVSGANMRPFHLLCCLQIMNDTTFTHHRKLYRYRGVNWHQMGVDPSIHLYEVRPEKFKNFDDNQSNWQPLLLTPYQIIIIKRKFIVI